MTTRPTTRTATGPADAEDVRPFPTSTVLAVILRVGAPVITDVRPRAVSYTERQICARIGDALLNLTDSQGGDPQIATRRRLPGSVSNGPPRSTSSRRSHAPVSQTLALLPGDVAGINPNPRIFGRSGSIWAGRAARRAARR